MIKALPAIAALLALTATTSLEAAAPVLQPVPFGSGTLRYTQGAPTIEVRGRNGVVQVTPLPMDHGCISFGVVVFNHGGRPADIDLGNVTAFVGDAPADVLTLTELQKRSDKRAFWTSMAVAAAGGLAAGIVAASSSHTTIRTSTAHGSAVTRVYYHDGAANGALLTGATVAAATSVQQHGQQRAVALSDDILGLTTVDPGDAYGGRVVIDKIKQPLPQTVTLSVAWNGEVYATRWQLAPAGAPAPAFAAATDAMPAPSASVAGPPAAHLETALFTVSTADAQAKPVKAAAPARPKAYPQDDTVQVPM
jgi:hypothetical protein